MKVEHEETCVQTRRILSERLAVTRNKLKTARIKIAQLRDEISNLQEKIAAVEKEKQELRKMLDAELENNLVDTRKLIDASRQFCDSKARSEGIRKRLKILDEEGF